MGSGVSGNAEAAVHAVRRLVNHMPDDHVFVTWILSMLSVLSEEIRFLRQQRTRHQSSIALCTHL